jgi:phospholipase C
MTKKFLTVFLTFVLLMVSCSLPSQFIPSSPTPASTSSGSPAATSPAVSPASPTAPATTVTSGPASGDLLIQARAKIKHIVVIMQENRSFDQYFGTYPARGGRFPGPERSVHGLHP